ncbi:hypothetical protein E6Q11_06250 [Candidatus Dojkabacteria bacterium]|uniref:Phage protein Gp138 N-terminal domain-containing protein n=1 Tax=Candidatus Dojkabacteria bacterium TaxID=2099670 RepID=A0A5C7J2Y2_9BACT|nr:MAG: hypothetical protein E6Q11_06250 [Candidatus Dojkabacteria bacterium]
MTQTPSLAQLLKHAIEGRLLDVHTALIAKVESYDAAKQLVNVAPVLKRSIENMNGEWVTEQLPVLCDVPVLFPRAGGFFITFPIQPGDFVQIIFNETDIEAWLEDKEPTISHTKRFTLQGAVALPGIFPQAMALTDAHESNLVLGKEQGLQIHIDDQRIRLGSQDANEALAIASKVQEELDRIKSAFHGHTHAPPGGAIKPSDRIIVSTDIAAKSVVAQ